MKLILFLSLISVLCFTSCGTDEAATKDIVSRDKMEDLLWDMLRTGEFLQTFVLNRDTTIDPVVVSNAWYEKVYALHEIDRETFDKSYAFYRERPELMKDILDSLAKRSPSIVEEIEPVPTDSIQVSDTGIRVIDPSVKDSFKAIEPTLMLDSNRRRMREKLRTLQSQ